MFEVLSLGADTTAFKSERQVEAIELNIVKLEVSIL
jgi:hypothetical protein